LSHRLKNKDDRFFSIIAHSYPKSSITEQYRLIRNNLHFSSFDKEIKTIVVTSPESSDGKSTTASNLAIVFAQQGKRVLLMDADLRKPCVHYGFKVSNLEGLTSVITKKMSLDDAILKPIPNLDVLTSGPVPPNPSDLLGSKMMELIMEELKTKYDYIVMDAPPILAVTDSQILASKSDGVVMVVASGKTHRDRAKQAKELLEKSRSQILGVVVNGVKPKKNENYGHYN
jgi:capsular exopolysaccharide synthesis family protein